MTEQIETRKPGQKLGFFMCVALVMGNMIGSGVFLLPASLAPFGWNGVAGWAITIAGALAIAFVLSRLTVAFPQVSGPIGFVDRAFGPVPSFMVGWAYWISVWTANVTLAVAAISFLSIFMPVLGEHSTIATIALIWIVTAINWRGARAAGRFQAATLLIKLIPLVTIMILIALTLTRNGTDAIAPLPPEGFQFAAISGSAILTLWALLGFESASVAADKVNDPTRTIPRATMVGTLATGIIYLVACSGIALMLPAGEVAKSASPFGLFVQTYWAAGPALFIAAFAAISAIGTLNGWTLVQAELPASMARQGLLPLWFAGENRYGTPAHALIISSAAATICVLLNSNKSTGDMFAFMAVLSTSVTLWLYLMCAAAALWLRVAMLVAVAGIGYALWTLWGADTTVIGGYTIYVSALSLILMVSGLPIYYWARRPKAAAPA